MKPPHIEFINDNASPISWFMVSLLALSVILVTAIAVRWHMQLDGALVIAFASASMCCVLAYPMEFTRALVKPFISLLASSFLLLISGLPSLLFHPELFDASSTPTLMVASAVPCFVLNWMLVNKINRFNGPRGGRKKRSDASDTSESILETTVN